MNKPTIEDKHTYKWVDKFHLHRNVGLLKTKSNNDFHQTRMRMTKQNTKISTIPHISFLSMMKYGKMILGHFCFCFLRCVGNGKGLK